MAKTQAENANQVQAPVSAGQNTLPPSAGAMPPASAPSVAPAPTPELLPISPHRWSFISEGGGSVTTVGHYEAARQLVHYMVRKTQADALALLEKNAYEGGEVKVKRLGDGVPGKCVYVGPHENPPQHSKRLSKRESA